MSDYNVKDFGGSVEEAVAACTRAGGGRVVIPDGRWKTRGPVRFCSRMELHLESGAVLEFSDRFEDYLPVVFTRHEGIECYNYSPLIYADGCEHVSITGKGTLIGNGQKWWEWTKKTTCATGALRNAEADGIPPEKRVYGTEEAALRPYFVEFVRCRDVLMEDFTIIDGPMWTLHPLYCENVVVRGVKVHTQGPNTDGCNPDSCRNVLIENCVFDTGDDCIAINSGISEDGWRVGIPCENIEIRGCVMNGGHGAVAIGSGMSGGVRNVWAHDCIVNKTMWGIRIKSIQGRGGFVEDVRFENFQMSHIERQAIQVTMYYEYSSVPGRSETPPDFRNIVIRNVTGSSDQTGLFVRGIPDHPIHDLTLENVRLTAASEVCSVSSIDNLTLKNAELLHA
ncbi:MAG: glycoside hydrolase family 28 protein [Lachnospiraceae bacterium]|jgi:polygalacturonase